MKSTKVNQRINISDKVTFDSNKIEIFRSETSGDDKAIKQYQQLVLADVEQVGIVKEFIGNLTTGSYPYGWDLPAPTKYIIVLP